MTMITRRVCREINASAQVLWEMVSRMDRIGEWSPESTGVSWLDGATGPCVGARFRGHNKRRVSWATTCEVIAADPGREFAFAVGGVQQPTTIWRYRFRPLAGDRTLVEECFELPRPLRLTSRLLTRLTTGVRDREADLEQGMRTTLTRLAGAAAADSAAAPPV